MKIDTNNLLRSEWEELISECIYGKNSERNKAIIRRRILDGVCFEPLAEEFDLSVQQTKTIVYKCLNKIAKHIK